MTRVVFTRQLPIGVGLAWDLLTDPHLMNRWSVAPVSPKPGGDPQQPGGTRVVHVRRLGVPLPLHETVIETDPPHRFRYQVRPNVLVKSHIAEQRLTSTPDGSSLTWEVTISSWVPGLMRVLVGLMRRQLESSLDRLVEIAAAMATDADPDAGSG